MDSYICIYLYNDPNLGWRIDDLEFPDYDTAFNYALVEQELTNDWCEVQANVPSFQIVQFKIVFSQLIVH